MASTLVDLVKINAKNTGTGAITLGSAAEGYRGTEVLTNGLVYSYSIQQAGAWEFGRGTYLAGTQQLVRLPLASSDGGVPISIGAGAQISFVALAEDLNAVSLIAQAEATAAAVAATSDDIAASAAEVNANAAAVLSAAQNVASSQATYSNAYAAALPQGVVSTAITAAGTGGTSGTYALGVAGGPTGFAGTYTISGGGVTAITITNSGLSASSTAPTLSFPSGSITGATATASVGSIIADQKTYWVVSTDGSELALYGNNGGAVATAPFGGTQATVPGALLISPRILSSTSKNKFNAAATEMGEVSADTGLPVAVSTSLNSGLVDIRDFTEAVCISGLIAGSNAKYYAYYQADGATLVTAQPFSFIGQKRTTAVIPLPPKEAGAAFIRVDLSRRDGSGVDVSAVQIEDAFIPTAFESFKGDLILTLAGKRTQAPTRARLTHAGRGKNLFNAARVFEGFEVHATTGLPAQDDDTTTGIPTSSISAPIDVEAYRGKSVSISGLQASATDRNIGFYSDINPSAASKISLTPITAGQTGINGLVIPANAVTMVLGLRERGGTATIDYSAIQVEIGVLPTVWEAYLDGYSRIDGTPVLGGAGGDSLALVGAGEIAATFGDSRWQTTNVESGLYLHGSNYIPNPLDQVQARLGFSAVYNFAMSGASFAEVTGLDPFQKINHQVDTWIGYTPASHATNAWNHVSAGTNDINDALTVLTAPGSIPGFGGFGDVATAMAKTLYVDESGDTTTTLDMSVTLEAMRLALWKIQRAAPASLKTYSLPAQRGDWSYAQMKPYVDLLVAMASIYGFTCIDLFDELNILHEFEGGSVTASVSGTTMTVTGTQMLNPIEAGFIVYGNANLPGQVPIDIAPGGGSVGSYTLASAATSPIASTTLLIKGGRHLRDGLHSKVAGMLLEADLISDHVEERLK